MTVTQGPWKRNPIKQDIDVSAPFIDAELWNGYDEASHRPRADKCPPICHACPLLRNPDGKFDVMPECWGGAVWNDLEMCHCAVLTSGMGGEHDYCTVEA